MGYRTGVGDPEPVEFDRGDDEPDQDFGPQSDLGDASLSHAPANPGNTFTPGGGNISLEYGKGSRNITFDDDPMDGIQDGLSSTAAAGVFEVPLVGPDEEDEKLI